MNQRTNNRENFYKHIETAPYIGRHTELFFAKQNVKTRYTCECLTTSPYIGKRMSTEQNKTTNTSIQPSYRITNENIIIENENDRY